jgi:hypothetical protein
MQLQSQKIKSYQHFLNLTKEFDDFYNTKTYASFLTLKEIDNLLVNVNAPAQLSKLINQLFVDNTIVFSNEKWLNDSHIGKINALSKIIDDIRNGIGVTSPISVSWFTNYKLALHPGTTRLMLSEVYHDKVPVIITDFAGNFPATFSNVEFFTVDTVTVDQVVGVDFSVDSTSLPDSSGTYRRAAPKNTTFKELTDHCSFYACPTLADPPRRYELLDNKLYVDNICYAQYNNAWQLII